MTKPIAKEFLFNVAEAFFRKGKYKKSIQLFDEFLKYYSSSSQSSKASLRIALSFEMLDKKIPQTLKLYQNTINKSNLFEDSYEAKLRYVALRSIRKIKKSS